MMSAKKSVKAKPQATEAAPEETTATAEPRSRYTRSVEKAKKISALDAAARVLVEAKEPMNCQELIKTMAEKGYWTSPGGKTPSATLHSAITREIDKKGKDARFKKTERGKFAATA
jgi:hypothetical protein